MYVQSYPLSFPVTYYNCICLFNFTHYSLLKLTLLFHLLSIRLFVALNFITSWNLSGSLYFLRTTCLWLYIWCLDTWNRQVHTSSRPALAPNQLPVKWVPRLCPGVKRSGSGGDHPPQSTHFRKILKFKISWTSVQLEPRCYMRTGRQDATKPAVFSPKFANAPKNVASLMQRAHMSSHRKADNCTIHFSLFRHHGSKQARSLTGCESSFCR